MDNNKLLTVSVKGPKSELYSGKAHSVTSINKKGKFDVLPYHISFISLIKDYVIIREETKKKLPFLLKPE
jgi:F0F1-type ATP synthase, epsilon subunit (mitochondrial delta subunit)